MTNRMASAQAPGRGIRLNTGPLIFGTELIGVGGASAWQNHESAQS
jgi:hypothetical protein